MPRPRCTCGRMATSEHPSERGGTVSGQRLRYAGVDVGTSGLKAAVLDGAGDVVFEGAAGYRTREPYPGWCEIDPGEWLVAFDTVRRDPAWPVDPDALAFTGQMHGVVVTDEAGVPLRPAVLWPDRRAKPVLDRWLAEHPAVLDRLDTPASPGYAGAILGWLAEREPDVMARVRWVWFAKDWLRARVTGIGAAVTDPSDASASLLWDPVAGAWLDDAVGLAGISREVLPVVRGSGELIGRVGATPVPVGAADTPAALDAYRSLDAGPDADADADAGTVYVNVGTGVQVVRSDPRRPGRTGTERVFADSAGGWYTMHALLRAAAGTRGALLDAIADAVRALGDGEVLVGGGVAHDAAFRGALASRLGRPIRYAPQRSLSACGAALLAATSTGHRIGLRQETVQVVRNAESDGSDR